jgi:hypothetical protein
MAARILLLLQKQPDTALLPHDGYHDQDQHGQKDD